MNFELPQNRSSIIKVLGIGGGGSNAVNYMFRQGIQDVNFIVCNTDAQALNSSPVPVKVQIGATLTEGLGAGNKPEKGRQAAIENLDDVMQALGPTTKMVFLTAGMGGGTGTGAAPVIAKACKENGILTVGIVTIPFGFEGQKRIDQAVDGIDELKDHVDSLLVINNEKLREIYGDLALSEAFSKADDVLTVAAKGIAEIITVHGSVNVDFADVETVLRDSSVAIMGSGTATGENRATQAIKEALTSPLLNSNDITGANSILLNITSGKKEITMDEVGEITDFVNTSAADNALIIWGTCTDPNLDEEVVVTIIATGFEPASIPELYGRRKKQKKEYIPLGPETENGKDPESGFEVKSASEGGHSALIKPSQSMIEFNISGETETPSVLRTNPGMNVKQDPEKVAHRLDKIKGQQAMLRGNEVSSITREEEIERMEDEPAYLRKNIKIDEKKTSDKQKISKYSLYIDDDNETKISDENPYLNDNVD
ncbi:MAG: cell division protein FtsZ [Chlorobi bacterium]|nr:cell division protein FtsZ [Chlorobiota bacterium]